MAKAARRIAAEADDAPGGATMGFLDHLEEVRSRLIRSCLAVAGGVLVAFLFVDRLADFVLAPTYRSLPPGSTLIFTKPGEAFAFDLDVALIGGVILSAPFVMYQVWRFIAPALYAKERRFVVPFVVLATFSTLAGAAFSHYVMFPGMISFFGTFNSPRMKFMPRVEDSFDLYKTLMLGMVAVFQMPTLVFFLAKMRLVTARFLWRHVNYAVLAIFIVAAALTPSTDPWNQMVFAAPMLALYLISIGVAWLVGPKRDEKTSSHTDTKLRLVIGAMVVDQARKHHRTALDTPRRDWRA